MYRVAIVGAGPSGFYAAEALMAASNAIEVTMLERLPVPYGLVRSGVAPDHPRLKQSALVFEQIATSPGFRYFGNVELDRDVAIPELERLFDAVILACGAEVDRKIGIPGEKSEGVHSAAEFVGWYNGHPDCRELEFDLDQEVVVVVGQGNVALDVARMLCKSVDELRSTDIAEHALDALARSRVKEVHIVGRRGPVQAKFTSQELRELGTIPGCSPVVDCADLVLGQACRAEAEHRMSRNIQKNLALFAEFAATRRSAARRCHFRFFLRPTEIVRTDGMKGVRFVRTELVGEPFSQRSRDRDACTFIPAGLVFRAVGFQAKFLHGLPFDRSGVLKNDDGRLIDHDGTPLPGLYATGWIKRGASGTIGTNRADSVATTEAVLLDLRRRGPDGKAGADGLVALLRSKGVTFVTFEDWRRIDSAEIRRGGERGKLREKFTRVPDMLAACSRSPGFR